MDPETDDTLPCQAGLCLNDGRRSYRTWCEELPTDDPGGASDELELVREEGPNDTDGVIEGVRGMA
jgi:hypothetical protein